MADRRKLEVLFLHALPLDGTMWDGQRGILPAASCAPTLYALGETVEEWAAEALKRAKGDRLIVVGCSVGGSCALELAAQAPERVTALVLIGTKAEHRPEPRLQAAALETLHRAGMEKAWEDYWAPLFSPAADRRIVAAAKQLALRQSPSDIARGITAFHTRPSRHRLLSAFPRPIIFVTGTDDSAPGVNTNAMQANMAPQGSLHIIPECGHYVSLEQPAPLNTILSEMIAARS
ncbi:MAG TPA: alpha/beta hydrolase [Terriglobia bacterium]|nr:alpha/beta hydrolase [Terriglobia bacterium]